MVTLNDRLRNIFHLRDTLSGIDKIRKKYSLHSNEHLGIKSLKNMLARSHFKHGNLSIHAILDFFVYFVLQLHVCAAWNFPKISKTWINFVQKTLYNCISMLQIYINLCAILFTSVYCATWTTTTKSIISLSVTQPGSLR